MISSSHFPVLGARFVFRFGSGFRFRVPGRLGELRTRTPNDEPNSEHEPRTENMEA
jgi:hypothetical protein